MNTFNSFAGISIAHNGNLTNSKELATQLFHAEMRHLNTDSDSEVLLNIFAHELGKQREIYPSAEHIFKAVAKTHRRCDGAYAVKLKIIFRNYHKWLEQQAFT